MKSSQSRKRMASGSSRGTSVASRQISKPASPVDGWGLRLLAQMREALLGPLRPFPLAHATAGVQAASTAGSHSESPVTRDPMTLPGITGLSPEVLQHAHVFMTSLPTWLPMPQTHRRGPGQMVLEWEGDCARQFSVMIGADGMLIYSARLGARGRFDGAEPVSANVSPIVMHAIRRLRD